MRLYSCSGRDVCVTEGHDAPRCRPFMKPLVIRLALPGERAALEALQWRASLAYPDYRDLLLAHPDAIEVPIGQIEAGQVWVAEDHADLVGFAAVLPRADGDLELDALFVEPGRWRAGIGRRLVQRCLESARERGTGALHVVGNPRAAGF
jgi:GNAT superfamily N-acetyltransferase